MNDSITTLVANFTRKIVAELEDHRRNATSALHNVPGSGSTVSASKSSSDDLAELRLLAIDTKTAEVVGNGTRIFPEPDNGIANWCIFSQRETIGGGDTQIFALLGIIRGELDPDQFLEQAYLKILKRPVDPVGRKFYRSRIETGQISQRNLLKTLASSREAREKGAKLVIVPQGSAWSGFLGAGGRTQSTVGKPIG
ncbi:MAG: DUF4214 domain-containing protein [Steroidobacteraceae bacterium]